MGTGVLNALLGFLTIIIIPSWRSSFTCSVASSTRGWPSPTANEVNTNAVECHCLSILNFTLGKQQALNSKKCIK